MEESGRRRSSRIQLILGGLMAFAAVVSLVVATGHMRTNRLADSVLLLPNPPLDNLELSDASMWSALGSETRNPEEAASTALSFRRMKADDADESVLFVEVEDRLVVNSARLEQDTLGCLQIVDGEEVSSDDDCRMSVERSQCSGLGPIQEGELDLGACIEEETKRIRSFVENPVKGSEVLGSPVLDIDEIAVREKPALLILVGGRTTVITFEGGGVVSTVAGSGVPTELVVDIAGRLQPTSPDEYTIYTSRQ
jgi:hypothetical protein